MRRPKAIKPPSPIAPLDSAVSTARPRDCRNGPRASFPPAQTGRLGAFDAVFRLPSSVVTQDLALAFASEAYPNVRVVGRAMYGLPLAANSGLGIAECP